MLTRFALAAVAALSFAVPAVAQLPNLPLNLMVDPNVSVSVHIDPMTSELRIFAWSAIGYSGPVFRFHDPRVNPATSTRSHLDVQLSPRELYVIDDRPCSAASLPIGFFETDFDARDWDTTPNMVGRLQIVPPAINAIDLSWGEPFEQAPFGTPSRWWGIQVCSFGLTCSTNPCGGRSAMPSLWGVDLAVAIR